MARAMTDTLFTGCNATTPRQYILRADYIEVLFVTSLDTADTGLRLAIVRRQAPVARICAPRVVR